jgi:hypothetical protein
MRKIFLRRLAHNTRSSAGLLFVLAWIIIFHIHVDWGTWFLFAGLWLGTDVLFSLYEIRKSRS